MIYVLGAIVLGTYAGLLLSLWLEWLTSERAWGGLMRARPFWGLSMVVTVWAFFHLLNAGYPDWLWLWFLISAITWVPFMLVDHRWNTHFSLLSVWSTAAPTVVIFARSLDRDGETLLAAFWLMFHHVFLDGVVWVVPYTPPCQDSKGPITKTTRLRLV